MISPCQQYELKFYRNSFKMKKQQQIQLNFQKQKQNPFKKQKMIISLTPKFLSFYSLKKDRQSNRNGQNQIQSPSKNIFKFSKTKNHALSTNQQNISRHQSQTKNPIADSMNQTKGYESCMANPEQRDFIKKKQTLRQNFKKGLIKRQQKQITLKSCSKTISIFKKQRTKQISCPKQLREMSSESIMRFFKKKQKKLRDEDNRTINRLLGNICQTMQYGLNPNFKVFKSQLNFTFGKSRSVEKY